MENDEAAELLEARRTELAEVLAAAKRQVPPPLGDEELASYDQHPADVATLTLDREQGLSMIEMAEASMRELEDAERRLREGKYGTCEVCGKQIPDERLRAIPETPFCIDHAAEAVA